MIPDFLRFFSRELFFFPSFSSFFVLKVYFKSSLGDEINELQMYKLFVKHFSEQTYKVLLDAKTGTHKSSV